MAIGPGTGGGGGAEDPYKTRRYSTQFGNPGGASSAPPQAPTYPTGPTPPEANAGTGAPTWDEFQNAQQRLGNGWTGGPGGFWQQPPQAPNGDPNANMVPIGGPPQIPGTAGYGGYGGGYGSDVGDFEGLDFTQRGAMEEYQRQHGGYFDQPTLSEMFARQALQQGAGAAPSNRAEEAFQRFSNSAPQNMDPYYDNERRKAEESIRKTMAARGSYGSSAADDLYNEAYTNLAADAARANAQYGLQRNQLLGSLAQGADQSSLAGSADRRNWMGALGQIAGGADTAGLQRITGGANIANMAQGAQTIRGQNAFQNQLQMGDRMSNIMGNTYGDIFGTDLDLLKTGVGLNAGIGAEGYNQASQNALQQRQNVSNFNNLLGGNMQMGQSVYDMFKNSGGGSAPAPAPMPQTGSYNGPPPVDNYGTSNWYYP